MLTEWMAVNQVTKADHPPAKVRTPFLWGLWKRGKCLPEAVFLNLKFTSSTQVKNDKKACTFLQPSFKDSSTRRLGSPAEKNDKRLHSTFLLPNYNS